MKVYCVCIEEIDDEGELFRVEIFSTFEKAEHYMNNIVEDDTVADIVEYIIDEPESGDTTYAVSESESDSESE